MIVDRESKQSAGSGKDKKSWGLPFPGSRWTGREHSRFCSRGKEGREAGLEVKNQLTAELSTGAIRTAMKDTWHFFTGWRWRKAVSQNKERKVFWTEMEKAWAWSFRKNFQECLPVFLVENYSEGSWVSGTARSRIPWNTDRFKAAELWMDRDT